MTKRILKSILAVSFLLLVASTGLTMGVLYRHFGNQLEKELRTEAEYLSVAIEGQGDSVFEKL